VYVTNSANLEIGRVGGILTVDVAAIVN